MDLQRTNQENNVNTTYKCIFIKYLNMNVFIFYLILYDDIFLFMSYF